MTKPKKIAALLCAAMLAGCASEEVTPISTELPEIPTEAFTGIYEDGEGEVHEEPVDPNEPVVDLMGEEVPHGGIFVTMPTPTPADAHIFVLDDDDPPEMPEFSMSTEGLYDFQKQDVTRVRFIIKAMIECSRTGEKPMINFTKYNYIGDCNKLENVKIGDWEVKDEKFDVTNNRYEITLSLDVTESENEYMPVGKADYLLIYQPDEGRAFLPLRKVGELDEKKLFSIGNPESCENFCNDFTAYFAKYFDDDVVTDFSSPDISEGFPIFYALFTARLYYPDLDFDMTYDEFDNAVRSLYGFSADAIDAKSSGYYDAEKDMLEIPGRGIYWIYGYVTDSVYDEENKLCTITIDYFADEFFHIKSYTYRYTVSYADGYFSMQKMERLYKSDNSILGGCI